MKKVLKFVCVLSCAMSLANGSSFLDISLYETYKPDEIYLEAGMVRFSGNFEVPHLSDAYMVVEDAGNKIDTVFDNGIVSGQLQVEGGLCIDHNLTLNPGADFVLTKNADVLIKGDLLIHGGKIRFESINVALYVCGSVKVFDKETGAIKFEKQRIRSRLEFEYCLSRINSFLDFG